MEYTLHAYIDQVRPLSIHARLAIGIRLFERYVRLRGLEDDSIWEYIEAMWSFPIAEDKKVWESKRGDLADFGLGDELPDELDEELQTLGISEDYFGLWVNSVTELAWNNLLLGPQDEESLDHLEILLQLASMSGVAVPELQPFKDSLFVENEGWGRQLSSCDIEKWQLTSCSVQLSVEKHTLTIQEEAELFFD